MSFHSSPSNSEFAQQLLDRIILNPELFFQDFRNRIAEIKRLGPDYVRLLGRLQNPRRKFLAQRPRRPIRSDEQEFERIGHEQLRLGNQRVDWRERQRLNHVFRQPQKTVFVVGEDINTGDLGIGLSDISVYRIDSGVRATKDCEFIEAIKERR